MSSDTVSANIMALGLHKMLDADDRVRGRGGISRTEKRPAVRIAENGEALPDVELAFPGNCGHLFPQFRVARGENLRVRQLRQYTVIVPAVKLVGRRQVLRQVLREERQESLGDDRAKTGLDGRAAIEDKDC